MSKKSNMVRPSLGKRMKLVRGAFGMNTKMRKRLGK
jgi:hypothetical protein